MFCIPPSEIWLIKKRCWCNLCVCWLFWLHSMPSSVRSTHVTRDHEVRSWSGNKCKISFWKIRLFLKIMQSKIIYEETWIPEHFLSKPASKRAVFYQITAVPGVLIAAKCDMNSIAKSVHLECGRSGRVQGERALLSSESFANNKGRSWGREGKTGKKRLGVSDVLWLQSRQRGGKQAT